MFIDHILQKILFNKLTTDRQKLDYFILLFNSTKWHREKIFIYIEFLRAKMEFDNKFCNN